MQDQKQEALHHPFDPVVRADARVLILGSFPSVQSRANDFYYGHPRNRFWKLLALLLAQPEPADIHAKISFLHKNHIALWDVVHTCTICGSADSNLHAIQVNDITSLLRDSQIKTVYANGQKAGKLYQKYMENKNGFPIRVLPSTSPANAAYSLAKLYEAWMPVYQDLSEYEMQHQQSL